MPLSAGDKLGPYEVLSPIGSGGMGEVYKARDTRLDRIVSIQVAIATILRKASGARRAVSDLARPWLPVQLTHQPRLSEVPIAPDCAGRDPEHLYNLLLAQPPEIT